MVMKFYHNINQSIRINFYTYHEVRVEMVWSKFYSKAPVGWNFDCMILLCPVTNGSETSDYGFMVKRASFKFQWVD